MPPPTRGSQCLLATGQKGCSYKRTTACRRCSLRFLRDVFCSFGVAQSGTTWGGCQNKLSAFLPLVCKSLFFNALNYKKSAPRCMRVKQKPTRPSRVRAPRRKAILYPSTAGRRQSPALQRPSRSRIGTPSSLRPHCNPDYPEKNDQADEPDERNADGI